MSQIAFHFFCHTGKTVIAFRKQWYNGFLYKKQWYNAVTPRDTPGLHHCTRTIIATIIFNQQVDSHVLKMLKTNNNYLI